MWITRRPAASSWCARASTSITTKGWISAVRRAASRRDAIFKRRGGGKGGREGLYGYNFYPNPGVEIGRGIEEKRPRVPPPAAPRQDLDPCHQAAHQPARLGARLFARRRGRLRGDQARPGRSGQP